MAQTRSLLAAALLLLAGCSAASSSRSTNRPAEGPATPVSTESDATVRLQNQAIGASKHRIHVAVDDLKSVGLWHPLTDHLYVVQVQSRPGAIDVPEDGHLADELLQGYADADGAGGLCSIMFFPAAITRNYRRVDSDSGATGFQPPPLRHVWASILAHELGHCFRGQPGEDVAIRWELRALQALAGRPEDES